LPDVWAWIDVSGAERARNIANTVGNGLQWWAGVGTVSWDYVTNYVFTQSISRGVGVSQALGQLSSLSALVGEVTQLRSDGERVQWLSRNYARAFAVAKSAMANLLTVFDHDVSSYPEFLLFLLVFVGVLLIFKGLGRPIVVTACCFFVCVSHRSWASHEV